MKLSKNTLNKAEKLGLYLDLEMDGKNEILDIGELDEDGDMKDPRISYLINRDETYNLYSINGTLDDAPAWIDGDKELRRLLNEFKTHFHITDFDGFTPRMTG